MPVAFNTPEVDNALNTLYPKNTPHTHTHTDTEARSRPMT